MLRRVGIAVAIAVVTLIVVRVGALMWTDYLWFDSLGKASVWRRIITAKVGLAVVFSWVMFMLVYGSWMIADRRSITVRSNAELIPAMPDPVAIRYAAWIGERHGRVRLLASAGLAILMGIPAASEWQSWLLIRFGGPTDSVEPQFGLDLSSYLFRLPFLSYALRWTIAALALTVLITLVGYFLSGEVRLQPRTGEDAMGRQVRGHVSALLGAIALVKAIDYYVVDRPSISLGRNATFDGAGYTATHAVLPATMLLSLVALFAAGLLFVNVRRKSWNLPFVAIALWAVVAVLAGNVLPGVVQRFQVEPQRAGKEVKYIRRNQAATGAAYGLDRIDRQPLDVAAMPSPTAVKSMSGEIDRVPVMDPDLLPETFQKLEGKTAMRIASVDLDRYPIDGTSRPIVIAAREVRRDEIPNGKGWETDHLVYTHGQGAVAAFADKATADGRPEFILSGEEQTEYPALKVDHSELYHGEGLVDWYAIVNSKKASYDDARFDADTGIEMSSWLRKAAFAIRFGEIDPLITSSVTDSSQLLFRRDIHERVGEIAPFLSIGSDPYLAIIDRRLIYVMDGFTTSAMYPYSQYADPTDLPESSGLYGQLFNYVRGSVKVTVDAYDGSVNFYRLDGKYMPPDPILDAWSSAFPGLFKPVSQMPKQLTDHLRYPADLLSIQSKMVGRYHVTDPEQFYDGAQNWLVARNPGTTVQTAVANSSDGVGTAGSATSAGPSRPTSIYLRMPEQMEESFVSVLPFTPGSAAGTRGDLTAFIVAEQDAEQYASLTLFTVGALDKDGERVDDAKVNGPTVVQSSINSDDRISREISLLDDRGSNVAFGAMTLLPVENSLVWIRPFFVTGNSGGDTYPSLQKVIAVTDGKAAMADTTAKAVAALLTESPAGADDLPADPASTGGGATAPDEPSATDTGSGEPSGQTPAELLDRAGKLLDEGAAALSEPGGLAVYQENQDKARALISEALDQLQGSEG